ncbi:AAA family ATPase [Bifidobacterium aquikefiri]|uniref:AAA family ATPase n=1 Tax=Bifidobacterium aquikefiri TaxID=1653207 RepID=UPI0039EA7DEC
MKTIAFLNSKGGVGKTTSTMLTALALHKAGYRVMVRDTDPSGGSSTWAFRAEDGGTPLPFVVDTPNQESLTRGVKANLDFVLIDTPPLMSGTLARRIDEIADVIVIVARPGRLDENRTMDTFDNFDSPRAILINGAKANTKALKELQEIIESKGLSVFDTIVPEREITRNAMGGNSVPVKSQFQEFALELINTTKSLEK